MSHMNFKMVGTKTKEGGWDDIREFKREHLIDTPGYVDDTGLLVQFEDKLTNSVITCNECFIPSENASYHKLAIDTDADDLINNLKTAIDATSSWNLVNVSYITDEEFNTASTGQTLMACCGNCATGTELIAVCLASRAG